MCQRHQIIGVHSGPEPMAAGNRHGVLIAYHGDEPREARKWMAPVLPFLTKPGALEKEAEAVKRERG